MNNRVKNISKWEKLKKIDHQETNSKFDQEITAGKEKGYDFDTFSQDLFSSLFQTAPEYQEESTIGTRWAEGAIKALQELPEFRTLRKLGTVGDSFQAGLGATILTRHFAQALPQQETENPDDIEQMIKDIQEFLSENPGHPQTDRLQAKLEKFEGILPQAKETWDKNTPDEQAIRIIARQALEEATRETVDTNADVAAFGFGSQPGEDGYSNAQMKLSIAEQLRNNPKLKEIANLAGRFRREARTMQANKKQPGRDEYADIEIGNDLSRVLPTEIMKLGNPLTELDFFRRYLEGSLMQYRLESKEKKIKGPVIFCLDNSGSMSGVAEIWSKAICLGLAQIATDQKRAFEIIHFDSSVCRKDVFPAKGIDPTKLIESCAYFSGGGTAFSPPLTEACVDIETSGCAGFKDADIIMITDGISSLDSSTEAKLKEIKTKYGASLFTICLGMDAAALAHVSDRVLSIHDFTDDSAVKETVFSI